MRVPTLHAKFWGHKLHEEEHTVEGAASSGPEPVPEPVLNLGSAALRIGSEGVLFTFMFW